MTPALHEARILARDLNMLNAAWISVHDDLIRLILAESVDERSLRHVDSLDKVSQRLAVVCVQAQKLAERLRTDR